MNTSTLTLFLDVMQFGSFTETAKKHDIAASSVSRSIANLESELGIKLFQRSTRKLEPTEAANIYYERLAPIMGELESARQVASDMGNEPRGTLRVTAPEVFGQMHLVPLLPEFVEKYPLLSIELVLTDAFLDLIEERIDLSIRLGSLQDSSYIARKLMEMEFFICASPGYIKKQGKPIWPQQIKDHNCLLFPRSGYNHNWLFKDKSENIFDIAIAGKTLITNSQAIRQCAVYGMGLALLPDWLVKDDIQSGSLIRLFEDFRITATDYKSAVWLLYPSRDYIPLKARVFINLLIESFN